MGVLAIDDTHPVRSGELEQRSDRGYGRLGVGDEQAAAIADEVILHVNHDQRRPCRVDADVRLNLVLGHLDQAAHAAMGPERSSLLVAGCPTRATRLA